MLNRTTAPAFSRNFSFELPQPEIIQLNDSLDLVLLRGLQQEVFKLEFIFKSGKWWETKTGISHFTSIMLDKGTASKSSSAIAELLDYHGSQIEISPGYDFTSVALYGLRKYFKSTFPLFLEILTEPSFPKEELELQKEIFLQNLKVNNEKNSFVASKLIRKNVFGNRHPYGSSIEETDVALISSADISKYFERLFTPHQIYLIGNFDALEIQAFIKPSIFQKKSVAEISFEISLGTPVEEESKPNSVQSSLRLGKRMINRGHPDFFALLLLNHILGGYFGSRLMKNIREEKGLTYGIYSSISPFKNDCLFSIGADVGKEKAEVARLEIKRELQKLTQQLVPPDELSTAKNHFMGSLQLEVASPFAALDKTKSLRLNQLPSDYYKRLFASIQSMDSSTLLGISEKYFSPDNLFEVTVG